jgi:hypothetical protein
MSLREIWRRITTTQYTRTLEAELVHAHTENALLRAENRALLNSILGIAGVPPIPVEGPASPIPGTRLGLAAPTGPLSHAPADTNRSGLGRVAAPMRRRSWQQIYRMLEFESAKKKAPEAI